MVSKILKEIETLLHKTYIVVKISKQKSLIVTCNYNPISNGQI